MRADRRRFYNGRAFNCKTICNSCLFADRLARSTPYVALARRLRVCVYRAAGDRFQFSPPMNRTEQPAFPVPPIEAV